MNIENTHDGHQRRIFESRPGVWAIEIRHRLTSKDILPELWSEWTWFGNGITENNARAKHDAKLNITPTTAPMHPL